MKTPMTFHEKLNPIGGSVITDSVTSPTYYLWEPSEGQPCIPVLLCSVIPREHNVVWHQGHGANYSAAVTSTEASYHAGFFLAQQMHTRSVSNSTPQCPMLFVNGNEGITNFILNNEDIIEEYKHFFHCLIDLNGLGTRLLYDCGRRVPLNIVRVLQDSGLVYSKSKSSYFTTLTDQLVSPLVSIGCGVLPAGATSTNINLKELSLICKILEKNLQYLNLECGYDPEINSPEGALPTDFEGKGTAVFDLDMSLTETKPVCQMCGKAHRKTRYYAGIAGNLCDVCADKIKVVGKINYLNWCKAKVELAKEQERAREANKAHNMPTDVLCPRCGGKHQLTYSADTYMSVHCGDCGTYFYVDKSRNACIYLKDKFVYTCASHMRKLRSMVHINNKNAELVVCSLCGQVCLRSNSVELASDKASTYMCKNCDKRLARGE